MLDFSSMAGNILKPPAAKAVAPPEMRGFDDVDTTRKWLYHNALDAVKNAPPVMNNRYHLTLSNPQYIDPERLPVADEQEAILTGKTLGRRIQGTWSLIDAASGKAVDTKRTIVGRVPYLTSRGTFIHNGTSYALKNQARLRPGIFARQQDNGEIEAHINALPGKGRSHRYSIDPAKSQFYVHVDTARIPLMPLLRTMGATDQELRDAWGDKILSANYSQDDPKLLEKFYQRFVRKQLPGASAEERRQQLLDEMQKTEFDPEVTSRTLGRGFKNLDKDAILATTKKLIAISRGEADVDDRDHLAFQTYLGPEDLIPERVARDVGGLRRKLLYKATFANSLKPLLAGALTQQFEAALMHSGLGQAMEQINAAEHLDSMTHLSRMGEGGISSTTAIPTEARAVQPSQLGFIDGIRTPESEKVGVESYFASGARKGRDGKVYSQFRDTKTGEEKWMSPQDLADLTIAFPGELKRDATHVAAFQKGRVRYVPRKEVDVEAVHFERSFSPLSNLVPLKSAMKGQRGVMASRMMTQALALAKPEAPLVQSAVPGTGSMESYEERYGEKLGAIRGEDQPGRVLHADDDKITVRYKDGSQKDYELANMYPYNRKSYEKQTPLVQPGQEIGPKTLLAKSNYTDDNGTMAMGLNARVAYVADKGWNHEDAITISDAFADRFKSEHLYKQTANWDDEHVARGLNRYLNLFPSRYSREQLANFDDDGVVKPGTIVNSGDPLVLLAKRRENAQNKVHRQGETAYSDISEAWEYDSPGKVVQVRKTKAGPIVTVHTQRPMQVGDKLVSRFADKGVVGAIKPAAEMPLAADGKPAEILMGPTGLISRGNPALLIELALGKIAAVTGKAYKVEDFEDINDLREFAEQELGKHGMSLTEDLVDPTSGRKLPQVPIGTRWFMKLHHLSEDKLQGRSSGSGYTASGEPAKTPDQSSKRLAMQDTMAILAHGAPHVLADAHGIRGQRNDDFWLSFMSGHNPPPPKVPMVYEKFVNELKGSGINVVREGTRTKIFAMTPKDVQELSGDRELKNADTVAWDRDLAPLPGGLFDPALTGGHGGRKWSHIKLTEPLLNPVMEEPVRKILGLTQKRFDGIVAGTEALDKFGTGPNAITQALKAIDLDKEVEATRAKLKDTRKTHREAAMRKFKYLKDAQALKQHPSDWIMDRVPVLPPVFRPVSLMKGNNQPLVSDANYLYRELIEANTNLAKMKGKVGEDVGDERAAAYNAYKALVGLEDPQSKQLVEKNVRGLLKGIFGSSPKFSTAQRKLLSTPTDVVGRAVLSPNPDYDMDTVGIPERQAWSLYKNFIVRRLHRRGMSMRDALTHIEKQSPQAKSAMMEEMEDRPVIVDRAPVLHKFGIMALRPRLVKADTIQMSPLIYAGYAADNDGDQMNFHVPISEKARSEAMDIMLPSRSLLSPSDFKTPVHMPRQEFQGGLYAATREPNPKKRTRFFATTADAIKAYNRGELEVDDPVQILQDR